MELVWLIAVVVVFLAAAAFLLVPYFDWQLSSGTPLEKHISRASFQFAPGELIPATDKVPEVKVSVIIPAFCEERRLPLMLDETLSYLDERAAADPSGFSYEVVVVDDGSKDATFEVASRKRSAARRGELRVMQLTQNRGKGFAVRAGMLAARGQLLLMADADGATGIKDLERLEETLQRHGEDGAQIAFGSRAHLKDEALVKRSFIRNVLMLGFHFVVWCLVGGQIHDTQCGFKLFRRQAARRIFSQLHLYRWAFDTEIVLVARAIGARIVEIPVTFTDMPGSKLNLVTGAVTMLRDIILVRVMFALGFWHA